MTEVEEAVGRLTEASKTFVVAAHYRRGTTTEDNDALATDIRTVLSALSEMQADISGKVIMSAEAFDELQEKAGGGKAGQRTASDILQERREARERDIADALATLPPAPEEVAGLIAEARAMTAGRPVFTSAAASVEAIRSRDALIFRLATALEQATTAGVGR